MEEKISVYLRLRNDNQGIWLVDGNCLAYVKDGKKTTYNSVNIIGANETNHDVYKTRIESVIERFLSNESGTIFAYGQTGSGKTYTIFGSESDKGIVQMAVEKIFESISDTNQIITLSFFEIFNEKIIDLFTEKELKIFTLNNKPLLPKLTIKPVNNINDVIEFINFCRKNRQTGTTEYNDQSSRSHGVFIISKFGTTLVFVDLAGSERCTKTIMRQKEGSYINKSLLALGKLVNDMLENKKLHFRESKLTWILQPTFEQKTNIVAICTLSCQQNSISESISTINFASRISDLKLQIQKTPVSYEPILNSKETAKIQKVYDDILRLYVKRSRSLEKTLISFLETQTDKEMLKIFFLEKQMFCISLAEIKSKLTLDELQVYLTGLYEVTDEEKQ